MMKKMIKFNLSNTFKLIPEGERVVTITKCEARPSGNPTEVRIIYTDKDGGTIQETIDFDKALWKISSICEHALHVTDGEEMAIDEMCERLVGKKIVVEVVHTLGTKPKEDGTFATFANVKRILSNASETTIKGAQDAAQSPRTSILDVNDL